MKKVQFNKAFSDGSKREAEGYAYKTANGIDVALHKEGKYWYATELTSGKLAVARGDKTIESLKVEVEKRSPTILKLLRQEQTPKPIERKRKKRTEREERIMAIKKKYHSKEEKSLHPDPFGKADDVYITKNKIAVTTTTTASAKRGYTKTTKTKYYVQNPMNLRKLKAARGGTVRVGRTGNKYRSI